MKTFSKVLVVMLGLAFALGLVGPIPAHAATTPSLGTAETYGVLSNLFQHNIAATTITGDPANSPTTGVLGYSSEAGVGAVVVVNGTTYVNDATWTAAGVDQNVALNNAVDGLNTQPCTSIGAIVDLASYDTDGPGGLAPGTFSPGCYSSTGAMNILGGGTVTLSGTGTFIFRPNGALGTSASSTVAVTGGASACDVFWAPTAATTLGANSTFIGTIIDPSGVTMSNLAAVTGRILAYGGTVTADSNTITVPVCAVVPPPTSGGSTQVGTINVVKTVINDNGGTKTVADFPLFVSGRSVASGENITFLAATGYAVTETTDPNYTQTFSGDCDATGHINLGPGDIKFCIVTNNDIGPAVVAPPVPPLIEVVKVPNPLALPAGPGAVAYTYTLRNIGTVPVTDVTMVGDTCSPITLASGDTNTDAILQVSETWTYTCSTTLSETHTNTVVATGWANGLSAVDIASATVVVGLPTVPPLIHVTKIPSPLTLAAGGGMVTYTERITNPGTVALSDVILSDDKCSPMNYLSGDTNGDSKLDTTETWVYTCRVNLSNTTTNTAIAVGQANGFSVRDFAIAAVTVATAVPALPSTGLSSEGKSIPWDIVILSGIFMLAAISFVIVLKKSTI